VKVKNVWSYTSTPPCAFMVWCLIENVLMVWYLVKHKDNFPFYL